MHIVIVPNQKGTPAGKLADAEIHFTDGLFAGLKLVGFAIWESQWPGKNLTHPHLRVTVPSREYTVGTERRRYDLVRPNSNDPAVVDALRDAILDAFADAGNEALQPEAVMRQAQHEARTGDRTPRGWRSVDTSVPREEPRRAPVAPRPAPARVAAPARRPAPPRPTGTDDDYPF